MDLEGLNQAQREAVLHGKGPLMILAGAGTGKTRVITMRMKQLVESGLAKASEILALTFTEKATSEMVERLDVMMPLGYEEMAIRTFHGFSERVLRERGHEIGLDPQFKILTKMEQWNFLRRNLFRFPLKYYRPLGNPAKYLSFFMSHFDRLKDEFIGPEEFLAYAEKKFAEVGGADVSMNSLTDDEKATYEDALKQHEMALLYKHYQEAMAYEGYMDFGDLVFYTLKLLETRPSVLREYRERYQFVMVDEFQDTNYVQTRLALLLAKASENIVVVGDDDQSIYRWRGASLSNIEQFQIMFPAAKRVVLNENYRSRQEILDASYKLIQSNNPNRLEVKIGLDKKLLARNEERVSDSVLDVEKPAVELRVFENYLEEVGTIAQDIIKGVHNGERTFKDYAILARTNSLLKPYADELLSQGIPFVVRSSDNILGFDEVKDLIAVARVLTDPYDTIAMYRVLNIPTFRIDVQEVFVLLKEAKAKHLSLFEVLKARKNDSQSSLFDSTGGAMQVLEIFENLLEYSTRNKPSSVLMEFLNTSGYLKYSIELENIDSQKIISNINAFLKLVVAFEKSERKNSLFELLQYIDVIEQSELPMEAQEQERDTDAVQLLTGHSSKGLEFPVVYIVSLVQNRFPGIDKKDPFTVPAELLKDIVPDEAHHMEEERRLMYVAMTRAQEQLICTYSSNYEGKRAWKPSVFLGEIFADPSKSTNEFTATSSTSIKPTDMKELVLKMPKGLSVNLSKLSYSQFDAFKRCPLQYSYRYIMSVPTPPSHASSYGTSVHSALNEFYLEMKKGIEPKLERLLELLEENWLTEGYESRGHEEKRKVEGREVLTKFFEANGTPKWIVPAYLEVPFSIKIGEARVGGRIDRIDMLSDGTFEIIDYKTGSSKKGEDISKDLQLTLYQMAAQESLGITVSKLSLYFIDDTVKMSTSRNEKQMEKCREEVLELVEKMKAADFAPTPGFACKFCDFKLICPVG